MAWKNLRADIDELFCEEQAFVTNQIDNFLEENRHTYSAKKREAYAAMRTDPVRKKNYIAKKRDAYTEMRKDAHRWAVRQARNQRNHQAIRNDPLRLANLRASQQKAEKAYREKQKADPERYAAYLARKREWMAKKRDEKKQG